MYRILKWSGTAVVYLLALLWVFLLFVLKGLRILQKKSNSHFKAELSPESRR